MNFAPRGQNSPMVSKFAPRGEVKNGSLDTSGSGFCRAQVLILTETKKSRPRSLCSRQGDQIVRIFAQWVTV
jgi:hypothetical protein